MANEFNIKNGFISNGDSIVRGGLTANTISATTISGGTFYGDGSNLTGVLGSDNYVTGGTFSGTTLTLYRQNGNVPITGFNSGGANIIVKNEGVTLTSTLSSLDFIGDGINATSSGNDVTVTVTQSSAANNLFNYYNFI